MKAIFALFLVLGLTIAAQASVEKKYIQPSNHEVATMATAGWMQLNGVCYRAGTYADARKNCEDDLQTINLLSNDRVVFMGSCRAATSAGCGYYMYELEAKAFVTQ